VTAELFIALTASCSNSSCSTNSDLCVEGTSAIEITVRTALYCVTLVCVTLVRVTVSVPFG
jgi:hypothetical protein